MNFSNFLSVIVTLFLLLACGFVCRKLGIIDTTASKKLSQLIISVGQPMLIISALNNADYSAENLQIALWSTVIGFVLHTVLGLASFLICRKFKYSDIGKIFEFSLVFANVGFIGFPILDSIFGGGLGSFMGAFYVISFHLFIWTWGIFILSRGRDDIKLTPKKILLNYGTVPVAIGVVIYLLKPLFVLPDAVGSFMNYLSGLCTPISVLITGALIATVPIVSTLKNKRIYLHSALKLIVFPVAVCLLAKLCGLNDTYVLLCTIMAGLPSASTITMLSELYEIEPVYASQTVGVGSLLTTATLPCVVLFAQWVISL